MWDDDYDDGYDEGYDSEIYREMNPEDPWYMGDDPLPDEEDQDDFDPVGSIPEQ